MGSSIFWAERHRPTYRIATDFDTVTGDPENGGILAERMRAAMQPPARVPEKTPPASTELVTRPEGANVTMTLTVPAGSPSCRQLDALAAAVASAFRAALASKAADPEAGVDADAPLFDLDVVGVFATSKDLPVEALEALGAVPLEMLLAERAVEVGGVGATLASGWAAACSFEGTLKAATACG